MGDKSSDIIWDGYVEDEDDAVYNRSDDYFGELVSQIPDISNRKGATKARLMTFWEFKMINDILAQKSRVEYPGYQSSKENIASAEGDIKTLEIMTG